MIKKTKGWIGKYLNLIDDFFVDFLTDIKSLRYQLILLAFAYNIFIVSETPENVKWGIGLLTAVYGFYFYSKNREHDRSAGMENLDPPTDRDPDEIED